MIRRSSPKRSTKPIARNVRPKAKRVKPRRVSVVRDRGYLDFLKERVCIACRSEINRSPTGTWPMRKLFCEIDPAHGPVNGSGSKGPDNEAVPICRRHHREQHAIGWPAFEKRYGFSREAEAKVFWAAYQIWKESQA